MQRKKPYSPECWTIPLNCFLFFLLHLAAPEPQFENGSRRLIITNPMKLYTPDWRSSSALFHRLRGHWPSCLWSRARDNKTSHPTLLRQVYGKCSFKVVSSLPSWLWEDELWGGSLWGAGIQLQAAELVLCWVSPGHCHSVFADGGSTRTFFGRGISQRTTAHEHTHTQRLTHTLLWWERKWMLVKQEVWEACHKKLVYLFECYLMNGFMSIILCCNLVNRV